MSRKIKSLFPKKLLIFVFSVFSILVIVAFIASQNREVENLVERTKFQVREAVEPVIKPKPSLAPSATAKVLTGGYQTFQTFNNCGPASLSMILRYFDINVSQHELGDQIRPYQVASGDNDDKSTTMPEMAKKAQEYRLLAYNRPNGNMELIKKFINADIPVVARTWLKVDDAIGHYRVIKGYDDTKSIIIQDDSYQGANKEYSYQDFNALWEAFNFEYLVVVTPDQKDLAETILGENVNEVISWERSVEISEKELARNPDNFYAEFNKSVALYHLGDYGDAATSFEKVETKLPFRMLWYQIEPMLTYQKLKNYARVFAITDRLINGGNRAYSEAYQIRGEVLEDQGKPEEARAEFAKVLEYNRNFFKYWE